MMMPQHIIDLQIQELMATNSTHSVYKKISTCIAVYMSLDPAPLLTTAEL
jgi:hypothetical protein